MSDPAIANQSNQTALNLGDEKALALGCVAFGALLMVSMSAVGAPVIAPASEIANLATGVLVLLGWLLPLFSLTLFGHHSARMLACWRKPEAGARGATESAIAALGSLILLLAAAGAYLAFGIGRMGGDPPFVAMWLVQALLAGGAGLLFRQRWAAVLVCGTGGWCLCRLMEARGASSVHPGIWTTAFWVASLVVPMTLAMVVYWPYLKSGARRGTHSSAGQTSQS